MSISPVFAGVSSFASDLQTVIARSVAIYSMPLTLMQNQLTDMNAQASALSGLDAKFSALQKTIQDLNTALGPASYSATSSDPTTVSASVSAGAMQGSFTIDVSTIGSFSASLSSASLPAVADPYTTSLSSSTDYTLTAGGHTFDIKPGDGSLIGLATAINSASAGVQATLVNTGNSTAPQYRLVIRSSNLGPDSIQLNDGSKDLLDATPLNTGELASYTVNGLPTAIQNNSRTVTLAPGVTVNLLQPTATGQPVTVDVARTTDGVSSAVSAFVVAYNAAIDALDQQRGKDAGALAGQSIVNSLYQSLSQITQYSSGSGAVSSLTRMGVVLDNQGKLTFNAGKFSSDSVNDLQTFLGSTDAGGFLKAANDALNAVEDITTGSVKTDITSVNAGIAKQNDLISQEQQRISDFQTNLQQQMAAADALIATLESQRNYLTNLFTAMMNSNLTGSTGVKSN